MVDRGGPLEHGPSLEFEHPGGWQADPLWRFVYEVRIGWQRVATRGARVTRITPRAIATLDDARADIPGEVVHGIREVRGKRESCAPDCASICQPLGREWTIAVPRGTFVARAVPEVWFESVPGCHPARAVRHVFSRPTLLFLAERQTGVRVVAPGGRENGSYVRAPQGATPRI